MNLESVTIKRFRSIDFAEVARCGGFNVLIGKNNSGKSNILSAISAFFACIQGGSIVTLDPPIGNEIDFHCKNPGQPIEITLNFSLLPAERDVLTQDIVKEAPQLRNAIETLDPSLELSATVSAVLRPSRFAFVSKLALVSPKATGEQQLGDLERIILEVGQPAAIELRNNLHRSKRLRRDLDVLSTISSRIDADDWSAMMRRAEASGRPPLRSMPRQFAPTGDLGSEMLDALEGTMGESRSYDDFLRAVQTISARRREEVTQSEAQALGTKVGTFAGQESGVPAYVRNMLGRLSSLSILHLTERRRPIGKEEAQRLLSLKVRRGGPDVLRNIQQTVSALLGVEIDAFESGPSAGRGESVAELDVDDFLVEVNGSGIREALRLVLDVEFEHPAILLVEEPEIHLHPGLEISMMQFLKRISLRCQVFVTTHSTSFLDTAEMKNVYLVSKQESTKTAIQMIDLDEAETEIPRELGLRLSSLFMFDRLVFVEGPSDESIIREWAAMLDINLSQSNVGFVPMRGARNFAYFAAEATLAFLSKRQVAMWFIVDRDERDDSDVAKLHQLTGSKASVRVLERREIENYLLCPRALADFIRMKRTLLGAAGGSSVPGPSESDVTKAIESCAEKLKGIAIDKRVARIVCRPVFPNLKQVFEETPNETARERMELEIRRMIEQLEKAGAQVEQAYKEQSKHVGSAWSAKRHHLIPGDLLLDAVCREFGVRYKKERGDGARLAALMRASEIPEEIRHIICEISPERADAASAV